MPEEFDIQKLLRLKRYEQPPPEYFQEFLSEFHHRQRTELLRQPLWRIALDRLEAFVGEVSVPRIAYVGATAAVLLSAGVASYNILNPQSEMTRLASVNDPARMARQVAYNSAGNPAVSRQVVAAPAPSNVQVWNSQPVQLIQAELSSSQAAHAMQTSVVTPRYVIDSRPISYERPSSF